MTIKEIGRYRVSAVHMPMSGSFENREIPIIFLETCTFSKIVLHVLKSVGLLTVKIPTAFTGDLKNFRAKLVSCRVAPHLFEDV